MMDKMGIAHIYQTQSKFISSKLNFDTTLSELFTRLFIDEETYERLTNERKTGIIHASKKLVTEVLMKKDTPEQFEVFVTILMETDQRVMAEVLQKEYDKLQQHGKLAEDKTKEKLKKPTQVSSARSRDHATNDPEQENTDPRRETAPTNTQTGAQPDAAIAAGASDEMFSMPDNHLQDPNSSYLHLSGHLHASGPEPSTSHGVCQQIPPLVLEIDRQEIKLDRNNGIGSGTYAQVYEAEWKGKKVAVKQIKSDTSEDCRKKLNKEIAASAMAKHPAIVIFLGFSYDKVRDDQYLLLVYEYIDGHNLDKVLNDPSISSKYQFTESEQYKVACETAEGIAFLHGKNMIHGDVKPANVMITKDYRVKICDFGLTSLLDVQGYVSSRKGRGTPLFQAPEMFQDESKILQYCCDIYSLGATLYNLFLGENMWGKDIEKKPLDAFHIGQNKITKGELPERLQNPDTPLLELIVQCVQFDPALRPSIQEVLSELKKLQGGIHE